MWKVIVISDTTKKTNKVKEGEVEVVDPIGDTEEIEEAVFISKGDLCRYKWETFQTGDEN